MSKETMVLSGSASALNTNAINPCDVSNYFWFSIQITGTWSGNLQVQVSNNETNWEAVNVFTVSAKQAIPIENYFENISGNGFFHCPLQCVRFLRVRMTSFTSGTANVRLQLGMEGTQLHSNPHTIAGDVSHDQADTRGIGPVKIGGRALKINRTVVGDGDRVDAMFDEMGRQVVILNHVRDLQVQQTTTITNSAAETTILTAGAAGVFHDITHLSISNASATATEVAIRDSTGGTIIMRFNLGALGSTSIYASNFPTALIQTTAANNWTVQLSSAVVSVDFFIQAVKTVS